MSCLSPLRPCLPFHWPLTPHPVVGTLQLKKMPWLPHTCWWHLSSAGHCAPTSHLWPNCAHSLVCVPTSWFPTQIPSIFPALVQMCLISSAVLIRPLFGVGVQGDLKVSEVVLPQSKKTQGTHRASAFSTDLTGLNSYPPTSPRELSGISLRARFRAETCLCPPCLAYRLVEELLVA